MRSPGRGYYGGGGRPGPPQGGGGRPYKVLCVSELHPKASDDVVRDTLYREYKKYGDISVRVVLEPDERVAYVYFRNFDDARDARHSKSRIILFDKPALVEPVYESRSESSGPSGGGGGYRPRRSMSPGYGGGGGSRYRSRSPIDNYSRRDNYRPNYRDDYHHEGGGGRHRDGGRPYHDGGGGRGGGGYHPRGRGGYHHRGRGGGGGYHDRGGHRGGHHDHYEGGGGRGHHRGRYDRRDGGPPGEGGRGGGGGGHRKDKFPNYLNHIPPEDDPLATRTLFAGNLELDITDEEMKRIFGRYGRLVDIDVKRPAPGTGNAYAFIRYENLDQAHRAKTELSGQYIGKFQCKIGYGKVHQTSRVWVGGLAEWCKKDMLEREFDRFGAMGNIDYEIGDSEALIQYESIDAAAAAVNEMRGFALGGNGKRIKIDFADDPNYEPPKGYQGNDYDPNIARGRGRGTFGGRGGRGGPSDGGPGGRGFTPRGGDSWGKRPGDDLDGPPSRMRRMEDDRYDPNNSRDSNGSRLDQSGASSSKSVTDLAKRIDKSWDGGIILKNSLFPTKLLLTEGETDITENLLKDETEKPYLKITQRLRLDEAKLEDVSKRINSSSSHAIFLALAASSASVPLPEGMEVQSRPLKNLVSYLKQKDAAGVISLSNKATDQTGVLYAFPPCTFSLELLRRVAGDLSDEGSKDDHLVVVVVKGG